MAYYIYIKEGKLSGSGQAQRINEAVYNAEVTEEIFKDFQNHPFKYTVELKEIEIDVPDYEEVETPVYKTKDVLDEDGNVIGEEFTEEIDHYETIQKPVMIDGEPIVTIVKDYDEEGNEIGEHEEIETPKIQSTHKETITVPYPVVDPEWEEKQAERREAEFNKAFFNTSLGYIRRAVTMADGSKKDFLSDLLPVISMGAQTGTAVNILAYDKPDFSEDVTDWTKYQYQTEVTAQFIQECFMQLSADFAPINEEIE